MSDTTPSDSRAMLEAAQDIRRRATQRKALGVAMSSTVLLTVMAAVTQQAQYLRAAGLGSIGFIAAAYCLRFRTLRSSQMLVVFTTIALVTEASVRGGGLKDPAVLAYPVILIWAGLSAERRWFFASACAVFSSIGLLLLAHTQDWPAAGIEPSSPQRDLMVTLIILSATVYAVHLLAASAKSALDTAYHEIDRRSALESELNELSMRDHLTGTYNRRYFDAALQRVEELHEYPASVIVADVDSLKRVNDRDGHASGDLLLVGAAECLSSAVRAGDVLARIGGDEFAILLPRTDEEAAARVMDRLVSQMHEMRASCTGPLSMSMGCATTDSGRVEVTVRLADTRMYEQKISKDSIPHATSDYAGEPVPAIE